MTHNTSDSVPIIKPNGDVVFVSSTSVPVVDKRDRSVPPEYEPFEPILDRILIRRIEADVAVGDLSIPEQYRQHTNRGEVVAIGDFVELGGETYPLDQFVNVGDRLLYGEYTAECFQRDGEDLWLVRIQDVRGVERVKRG